MTGPISYDFLKSGHNIFTENQCAVPLLKLKIIKNTKKKIIVSVGYNKRFDRGVIAAKKLLNL